MTSARNRDPLTTTSVDLGEASLILHSQANISLFPNNVMSSFRSKLTKPLPLFGGWTIAMQSMQYNKNIINLEQTDHVDDPDIVRLTFRLHSEGVPTVYTHRLDLTIPPGIRNAQEMASLLNEGLQSEPVQHPANMNLSMKVRVWVGHRRNSGSVRIIGTFTSADIFGTTDPPRKGRALVDHILSLFNNIGNEGSVGMKHPSTGGYRANCKSMTLITTPTGMHVSLHAGSNGDDHRAQVSIMNGTPRQRRALQRLLGFSAVPSMEGYFKADTTQLGVDNMTDSIDTHAMNPGTLGDMLMAAEDGPLGIEVTTRNVLKDYESVVLEVDNTKSKRLSNPFRTMSDHIFLQHTLTRMQLPVDIAGESLRQLSHHSNAVHLEFGWRATVSTVNIIYSRTAFLPVPGSYRNFKVFSTELCNMFARMEYHEDRFIDLSSMLVLVQESGCHKLSFRLKARGQEFNYIAMNFSPQLAVLMGLLPPLLGTEPDTRSSQTRLLGGVFKRHRDLTGPFPGLGTGDGTTLMTKDISTDAFTNVYTCPHPENYDLGITEMNVYLPNVVDSMSLGQRSAPFLDSIPINNDPASSNRVHHTVVNPRQRRLLTDLLDETEVEILDGQGNRIKFPTSINGVTFQCSLLKHTQ